MVHEIDLKSERIEDISQCDVDKVSTFKKLLKDAKKYHNLAIED